MSTGRCKIEVRIAALWTACRQSGSEARGPRHFLRPLRAELPANWQSSSEAIDMDSLPAIIRPVPPAIVVGGSYMGNPSLYEFVSLSHGSLLIPAPTAKRFWHMLGIARPGRTSSTANSRTPCPKEQRSSCLHHWPKKRRSTEPGWNLWTPAASDWQWRNMDKPPIPHFPRRPNTQPTVAYGIRAA